MFTISSVLNTAALQLQKVTDTAMLEASLLLAYSLQVSQAYFLAHPQRCLTDSEQINFLQLVKRRAQGEPIAYITGRKEFWLHEFYVTPATLIPRPETELLVELALEKLAHGEPKTIADLGTGSGAIAISLALSQPSWQVYATDIQASALEVAMLNAKKLRATNITFRLGEWCKALPALQFDAIVCNPPYIAAGDEHISEQVLQYEPYSALIAQEQGMQALQQVISQAKSYLKTGGYLMLEHGFQQAAAVAELMALAGYEKINLYRDLANLERVTIGQVTKF
jgi:release factor glutamine methyltransferase